MRLSLDQILEAFYSLPKDKYTEKYKVVVFEDINYKPIDIDTPDSGEIEGRELTFTKEHKSQMWFLEI